MDRSSIYMLVVSIVIIAGCIFVEDPRSEFQRAETFVAAMFSDARIYVTENPKQTGGSAFGMLFSSLLWWRSRRRVVEEPKPAAIGSVEESGPVARSKNRALYNQLESDLLTAKKRQKELPSEIDAARKKANKADEDVEEARKMLVEAEREQEETRRKFDTLVHEASRSREELAIMDAEMQRLKRLI